MAAEPLIAVFVDFENLALGAKDVPGADVNPVSSAMVSTLKEQVETKEGKMDNASYRDEVLRPLLKQATSRPQE